MNDRQMFCEPLPDLYKILRVVPESLCYNGDRGEGGILFMGRKRMTAVFLLAMLFIFAQTADVSADASDRDREDPIISLGADLTEAERDIVLDIFGIEKADLETYRVNVVTNQEEHQYLDAYLDKGIIGDRALSSVMVTVREKGYGIHVTTQNISYCTVGMYQSALATAGMRDADIMVAAPFNISGTAALIGAIRSYESLTGQVMDSGQVDTAIRELSVASGLGMLLEDPVRAEQLIGMIKNEVMTNDHSQGEIGGIIDQIASEMQISLTEGDRQKILDLMDEVKGLDLNIEDMEQQISIVYDKLQNIELSVDKDETKGLLEHLWGRLGDLIVSLF